jgi:hypothetical protein
MKTVKYNVDLCFSQDGATLYHAARLNRMPPQIVVTAWHTSKNRLWTRVSSRVIRDTVSGVSPKPPLGQQRPELTVLSGRHTW